MTGIASTDPDADATRRAIPINERARQATLIARMAREAHVREEDLAGLRSRLETAEHELESAEHELQDLRAIRDALTPSAVPQRPGMRLAAAFLPAGEERVSGDFYLVAKVLRIPPSSSSAMPPATA